MLALVVVYVLGAALRLARYNVESSRPGMEGPAHVTLVFRGLPTPAAAGVVASLVLLRHEYELLSLDWAILLVTPALGLLMISRLPYPHLLNRFLEGNRPLPAVALLVVVVFLFSAYFQETITGAFVLYAGSGPVLQALARRTARLDWVAPRGARRGPRVSGGRRAAGEEAEPSRGRGGPRASAPAFDAL